jgi:hypothetical protein
LDLTQKHQTFITLQTLQMNTVNREIFAAGFFRGYTAVEHQNYILRVKFMRSDRHHKNHVYPSTQQSFYATPAVAGPSRQTCALSTVSQAGYRYLKPVV